MEDNNSKHAWFRLSHRNAKKLLTYFIILITLGLILSLLIILDGVKLFGETSILNRAIFGSMATSLLGSSIYYCRKLYKACINLDMIFPENEKDQIRQSGVILYFILRPVFSICFSVLTVLIIKSGIFLISECNGVKENFIFCLMTICFFIGYSSGDFIDVLEDNGKKIIKKVINE